MDMSTASVCVTPSVVAQATVVFFFVYPLILWGLSGGHGRAPMLASVMPAALTPLFAGMAAAWVGLVRVRQAQSLVGGGRASSAAGTAESLTLLVAAAAVAAMAAAAFSLCDVLRRREMMPVERRSTSLQSLPALVCAALIGTLLFAARVVAHTGVMTLFAGAVVAAVCAMASFVWLIASRRVSSLQLHANRRVVGATIAICAMAIAAGVWRVIEMYAAIARG